MLRNPGPGEATPLNPSSKSQSNDSKSIQSKEKLRRKKQSPEPAESRRELGAAGEGRAANFLRRRGYLILERNIRYGGVEVDLIARRGPWIAFIEVKTRRTTRFGSPQTAVDQRKQERLVRAASAWLATHQARNLKIRFDVIACLVTRRAGRDHWQIDHLAAAFDAAGMDG